MNPAIRHLMLAGTLTAAACSAQAQAVRILEVQTVRAERSIAAEVRGQLASGREVELQQISGGWAQVRSGTVHGWVRASALEVAGADVGAASRLDTGRRAAGNTAVTLGIRALPSRKTRHALIVGVGTYRADGTRPVPGLAGVQHDMVSALAIAQLLQVPMDNITLLRDGAATRDGVQQALSELDSRVQPGDRVFIYWSGYGSRQFDAAEGGCVGTLVPHDMRDVGNRQFAQWILPLAAKADKTLVLYDASHASGVDSADAVGAAARRALAAGLVPKSAAGGDACRQLKTLRNRGLDSATRALGLNGQDLAHLSSSQPDEVSFDHAGSGGLATSSLRQCLQGDVRDLDGSGATSVDEWASCAQAKIDVQLRSVAPFGAQHLVITGNRGFVPAWFAGNPAPHVTAPAITAPSPPVPQPVPATPSAVPEPPATTTSATVQTVLEQIHAQRDSKRRVAVTLAADRLRIGADALNFSITSSHDGHVFVAMLGSDRQSLYLLFPNELDGRNRIAAGESMLLPRAAWRVVAGGPKGDDTLLVMVTDAPRELGALGGGRAGPFTKPLTDAGGRSRLQWLLGRRTQSVPDDCSGAGCSDAFGSALLKIEEY